MNEADKVQRFGDPQRRTVVLAQIRREDGAQVREGLDLQAVADYAESYRNKAKLPPITLFDDNGVLRIADGFHRWAAAQNAGLTELDADVYTGDMRQAELYSTGANAEHGVRRTTSDVNRAINKLLADAEWRTWSDREIARHVGCSHTTVGRRRTELEASEAAAAGKGLFDEPDAPPPPKVRKGADNRTINVSNIGKGKEEERIAQAVAEAERLGQTDAADSAPRSRRELMRAIKETVNVDVPDHAVAGVWKNYTEARDRELEQRARAAALAAAKAPATYKSALGGPEGEALQGLPLRTATTLPTPAELMAQAKADLGQVLDRSAELRAQLDAAQRDLRNVEARLRKEEQVNTTLMTAIMRAAAMWKGAHDGPRSQLLALLEEEGLQVAADQWDRALARAGELGRQESAALVAELQQQLAAAKEDARLLRLQVQELEQAAAVRRQRALAPAASGECTLLLGHEGACVNEDAKDAAPQAQAEPAPSVTVLLTDKGSVGSRLLMIKAVREVTGLLAADAKALIDLADHGVAALGELARPTRKPPVLALGVSAEEAEAIKAKVVAAGGAVEIVAASGTPQAQAEPPPAPAAPTWAAASIGGAKAVHAVDAAALAAALAPDAEERHPLAKCRQRPTYKSGWQRRPGEKITCAGCRRAVEAEASHG